MPELRPFLWVLATFMLVNAVLAGITYGRVPGYLMWGGVPLMGYLVVTSRRGRRWMS